MSYNKDFDGQVKFTFQPRYGFRAWKTGLSFTRPGLDFTPKLESLSYDYEWTPGENVAHTDRLWMRVLVEAWDRVIVGPKGMRSSRARIVALARTLIVSRAWVESPGHPDIDALTDHIHEGLLRYDVPIFDSVRSMLDAFPLTPPPPPKEAAA